MDSCLENRKSNKVTNDKEDAAFRFLKLYQKGLKSYIPSIDSFFQDSEGYEDTLLLTYVKELEHHHLLMSDDTLARFIFQNYVLPYKLFSERNENWRRQVLLKYSGVPVAKDSSDYVPIARKVVEELRGWFKFSSIAGPVYSMTYEDILARGDGDCISESKLGAFSLRALGVPVSVDFTCSFGNIDGSLHMWNSIVYVEGRSIPFMAAETPPYSYDPFIIIINREDPRLTTRKKCAKIFRRTYQINGSGIDFSHQSWLVPEVIRDNRFIDITGLYQPVSDIQYNLSGHQSIKDSVGYICVYNKGDWKPAYWSTLKNDSTWLFPKMGRDLLYIIGVYVNKEFVPASYPFMVERNGNLTYLAAQSAPVPKMIIKSLISPVQMQIDTMAKIRDKFFFDRIMEKIAARQTVASAIPGEVYELQVWKNHWEPFQKKQCTSQGLYFDNVPGHGLYRIASCNRTHFETRVFTYNEHLEEQVWL